MKNTKRRFEIVSFYDHTGIAAHLERMARKGWALEKMGNAVWRYRRIEPASLRYAVVYQPTASEFDSQPTEAERQFEAFCAQAGWQLVTGRAQMQIYCCADPEAIPIETDPQMQVEAIHRAMKKNYIPSQIAMIFLAVLQFLLGFWRYRLDPLSFLASSGNWVGLVCYGLILVMSAAELGTYYRWRKKALGSEGFCPTRGTHRLQLFCLAAALILAAVWMLTLTDGFLRFIGLATMAMTLLMLAAALGIKALMKRMGASRNATRTVYWITALVSSFLLLAGVIFVGQKAYSNNWFEPNVETYEWEDWTWEQYHDELPLYVQDLTAADYPHYSTQLETRLSPILKITTAVQEERVGHSGSPNLRYEIYDTLLPGWIEALVVEDYTIREYWDFREFRPEAVRLPGAEVSRLWEEERALNTWLLRAGGRIIVLSPDWELTQEQLVTAAEVLLGLTILD